MLQVPVEMEELVRGDLPLRSVVHAVRATQAQDVKVTTNLRQHVPEERPHQLDCFSPVSLQLLQGIPVTRVLVSTEELA